MSMDVGFSLNNEFLREAYKSRRSGEPSREAEFVEYVADQDGPIEIYLSSGDMVENSSTVEPAKKYADHFGLDIEGIHLTRLYELGLEQGETELRTRVYNSQVSNRADASPRFSPSTITFHPPKYDDFEDLSRKEVRRNTLEAMDTVQAWINDDERLQGSLAVENVVAPQRYVIETPGDVRQLEKVARDNDLAVPGYTLDNGHADNPVEIAEAMGEGIENVHLHDRTPENRRQTDYIRDRYGIPQGQETGTSGERQGELTHLPPGAGDTDIEAFLEALEQQDYDGNLMLEVHPSFARFGQKRFEEDVDNLEELL